MENKKKVEVMKTIYIIGIFLVSLCAIATFAGCLNYATTSGESFYWLPCLVTAIIFVFLYVREVRADLNDFNADLKEAERLDNEEDSDEDL